MKCICAACGESFKTNRKRKYCDAKCYPAIIYKKRYNRHCKQCSKAFNTSRKHVKLCSAKCVGKWRKEKRRTNCEHCNKSFIPKNPRYTRFCSRECAFDAKKPGGANYTWCTPEERAVAAVKKWVKRRLKQHRYALKPCSVCRRLLGHGATKQTRLCKTCTPAMRDLYSVGITQIRSLICIDCQAPRESSSDKYTAGKRCKECEKKHKRQWKSNHRSRCRKYGGTYDPSVRLGALIERDEGECAYCGITVRRLKEHAPDRATIDHIVPLSKGGDHTWGNVVLACIACNVEKSDSMGWA